MKFKLDHINRFTKLILGHIKRYMKLILFYINRYMHGIDTRYIYDTNECTCMILMYLVFCLLDTSYIDNKYIKLMNLLF